MSDEGSGQPDPVVDEPDDKVGAGPGPASSGPPGGRIFSLEGRPAPSLYLIGWLATAIGLATIFVGLLADSPSAGSVLVVIGVVVLLLGLAFAAGYQLVARADRPADAYRGPSPLILFGITFGGTVIASVLLDALVRLDPTMPVGFLVGLIVTAISFAGTVWLFVVRGGALSWRQMGWPDWVPPSEGRLLARLVDDVALAVTVILPTIVGVSILGGILTGLLGSAAPSVVPAAQTGPDWVVLFLAAAVVAPIGEEVFFRGFALTAWWRDLGPRSALIRASFLFALVHILNVQADQGQAGSGLAQAAIEFAIILPVGFVLGWLFIRRGIVASIAGHMTYNGVFLALLLLDQMRVAT